MGNFTTSTRVIHMKEIGEMTSHKELGSKHGEMEALMKANSRKALKKEAGLFIRLAKSNMLEFFSLGK